METKLLQQHQEAFRAERARAYHAEPDDFYNAYWYLDSHPIFQDAEDSRFFRDLWLHVAKVDPATGEVEDDPSRNTRTEVWLETGPLYRKEEAEVEEGFRPEWWVDTDVLQTHDPYLDCGGATFEEALKELARLVALHYGDDRSKVYAS